ncbi:hypothetical protein KFL_000530090 [Klebsormidium nitens]|uniref:Uncharacterized protein n=1 Tax=Klebsormidium nitens TaxID=105231 RepID=A0A1Y1HTQ4_KLENI|nr:hypothetical protein KFL_000530090 [Klebsormidium nitens]|eukprot:GAQ80381.1 hypothetical protein KFL_000530090 [Klebsormidium nitens]
MASQERFASGSGSYQSARTKGKTITVIAAEDEVMQAVVEEGGKVETEDRVDWARLSEVFFFQMQSEDFQGEKMQEIQALAVEYETAEILKAEATLRNLYAEAVAREREAQIEAAEEETRVLEEVERMINEAREKKVDFQRRTHEEAKEKVREAQATREREIAAAQRRANELVSSVLKNRPLIWEEPPTMQEQASDQPSPRSGA